MTGIEYRGTNLKTLPDGATGTESDPITIVRGLAVQQPNGTFAEVSDENPVSVSIAPCPMGQPITASLSPGDSIELIPAPTDPLQQIHLYGIYLTFSPSYILGTEIFEALIYASKTGQPAIPKFPFLGTETFDGFASPVEIEAGYSLRLEIPGNVEVTEVLVYCALQYRYGYPQESVGGGGGGTAAWGDITGTLTDQTDLEARLAATETDIVNTTSRVEVNEGQIVDLVSQDTIFGDEIVGIADSIDGLDVRLDTAETTISTHTSQVATNTSAIAAKQDRLVNGIATTYNATTKAVDVIVDGTTINVVGGALKVVGGGGSSPDGQTIVLNQSSQLKVVYEPRPPTRGSNIQSLAITAPNYDAAAIAPSGKILRVSYHVSNFSAGNSNVRFTFKDSAGVELTPLDIYQKSVSGGGGWDSTFSGFSGLYIKDGESLGVYANVAGRLNANITSELIYEGDCQSFWLNATPIIPSCTIAISYRQVFLSLFNATSTTSTYTIDVVDGSDNVVSQVAVATALFGRNTTVIRVSLTAGRRLRVSSATVDEIFLNVYAVESAGW